MELFWCEIRLIENVFCGVSLKHDQIKEKKKTALKWVLLCSIKKFKTSTNKKCWSFSTKNKNMGFPMILILWKTQMRFTYSFCCVKKYLFCIRNWLPSVTRITNITSSTFSLKIVIEPSLWESKTITTKSVEYGKSLNHWPLYSCDIPA